MRISCFQVSAACISLAFPLECSLAQTAEPPPAPEAAVASANSIDPALLKGAIQTDSITVPTPGELFEAFSNVSTPNWTSQYRQPVPTAFSKRTQIAMNVGGLIADGYLAVEGMDSQQVKNIGKDIITLARGLGVSEQVLGRGSSIAEFAENNEWIALKEELEATQDEVKLAMEEMRDQDLVTLVSLGGWLRGTQAVTGLLQKDYTPETAAIIRQPALVGYIIKKIDALSEKSAAEPLVQSTRKELVEIQTILATPPGEVLSKEQISTINGKVSALITAISTK